MSEILPTFLKNKFLNEFQEAERELGHKKLPHHSLFQKIQDVLEHTITSPSMVRDAKASLYDLNDTLADCVMFCEKHKAHKMKPFSPAEYSFLCKTRKQLHQIIAKLRGIQGHDADAPKDSSLLLSSFSSEMDHGLNSSLFGYYKIRGFDQQSEKIIELLRERKAVGIVGTGGLGKTTITEMVVRRVLAGNAFEYSLICHMPLTEDKYDDIKTSVLVKFVEFDEGILFDVKRYEWSIEEMLEKVSDTSKCLIVLDGVKYKSDWYKEYFLTSGTKGPSSESAIIVTSRLQEVAEWMVGNHNLYRMEPISEPEDIWLIFQDEVKKNRLIDVSHPTLLRMKEEIVERCYGLPLAAKALAEIISNRIYEVDCEITETSIIIPRFLKNKFMNDLREAEGGIGKKFRHQYSMFQEIKYVLEQNIVTPSTLRDSKALLYTLNETLADCVTFYEQHKADKWKPFSMAENKFFNEIQKQLHHINVKLRGIKDDTTKTAQGLWLPSSETSDNLEKYLDGKYKIHGFDQQLEKISELLDERKEIGIVGIGGSGKTALAQMVVGKALAEELFRMAYWVSLSDHVDTCDTEMRVLVKCIKQKPGWDFGVEKHNDYSIKRLSNLSRCLIVLDGTNHISHWYKEVASTRRLNRNAIIVTSRLQEVAEGLVGKRNLYHMQPISVPEKIWSIFVDTVEESGLNARYHPVRALKDEIVERCYGLPLAIRTLAEIIPRRIIELDE
ncbi:hypothetical protein L1049_012549 [Liquidambar formosana]|uniref:NB-ARC domain-containing protein n=1 Tax=Liquidambar formosana TaxID=63359 RepID=A0AAP0N948_LIQFO